MLQLKNKAAAFKRRARSKRGETLVEILASIVVIVIFFTGVVSAVAVSQQTIYTDNNKEMASQQAQEVADEIVSLLSGLQDASQEADLTNAEYTVETYYGSGGLGKDTGAKLVSSFSDPTSDSDLIQYTITTSTTDDTDVDKVTQAGYNITVRVYYKRISNGASYTCAEVNAFAAAVIAS